MTEVLIVCVGCFAAFLGGVRVTGKTFGTEWTARGFESASFGDDTVLVSKLDGFVDVFDRLVLRDKVGINDGPTNESTSSETVTLVGCTST